MKQISGKVVDYSRRCNSIVVLKNNSELIDLYIGRHSYQYFQYLKGKYVAIKIGWFSIKIELDNYGTEED